jgi:hypothetical protein
LGSENLNTWSPKESCLLRAVALGAQN